MREETGVRPEADYGLKNEWSRTRERLSTLEAWLDQSTRRNLRDCGLRPGWSCLEVGAGGGSIATWLADSVGASGEVLATDIDPRFVEPLAIENLHVLRHDIAREPLPKARFDLAHCRLVLAHLPQRHQALESMIDALKPGGWVVVEEMDFVSIATDPRRPDAAAFHDAVAAHLMVLRDSNFDGYYGRRLVDDLRLLGLEDVGSNGHAHISVGGTVAADAMAVTLDQLREGILATGLSADTLDRATALCADPEFSFLTQTMVAAWGRVPPSAGS